MKKDEQKTILAARAPKTLVRKLDAAAKANRRSRSAEMLVRLEASLTGAPAAPKAA